MSSGNRIAVCYRGIHYSTDKIIVDYRDCFQNHIDNLISPLLSHNNHLDIFCLSYESPLKDVLIANITPVDAYFFTENDKNNGSSWHRQLLFHKKSAELIHNYESKYGFTYDIVINLRYDLYFTKSISGMNVNYNKINIAYEHRSNNCDDNLFIIPRTYLDTFYSAINTLIRNGQITHELNKYIDESLINYMYVITDDDIKNNDVNKYWRFERRII